MQLFALYPDLDLEKFKYDPTKITKDSLLWELCLEWSYYNQPFVDLIEEIKKTLDKTIVMSYEMKNLWRKIFYMESHLNHLLSMRIFEEKDFKDLQDYSIQISALKNQFLDKYKLVLLPLKWN